MFLTIHEPIVESVPSFIDALKAGKPSAYIGIIVCLAIVIAVLAVTLVFRRRAAKSEASDETIAVIPPAPVPAPEAEPVPASDDTAIVAAIIAAISAHTGKAPTAFRVVSFKRRR